MSTDDSVNPEDSVSAEDSESAEGWCRDPYLVHDDRWYSDGQPTKLVRDGGAESYDPPPPGPPKTELVKLPWKLPRPYDPDAGKPRPRPFDPWQPWGDFR
jgi:hypothetical protein